MPARASCPVESAPGDCMIERGPLVLAMTRRFNNTGDGWCYAAPVFGADGQLPLKPISLRDPAGQTTMGWRMKTLSRYDVRGRLVVHEQPVTLVAFSDAGTECEPYVAAFPLRKTLDSLPP